MSLKLDFTRLNKLTRRETQNNLTDAPEAAKTSAEEPLRGKPTETPHEASRKVGESREAPQGQQISKKALINLTREKEDMQRTLEIYRRYQDNIKKAGNLREDIFKGVQAGEPVQILFLKAVECISRMTGNQNFLTQIAEDFKVIYGEAFLEKIPLAAELGEVEKRLEKLKDALARETTEPNARDCIKKAIKKHEEKRERLKEFLKQN